MRLELGTFPVTRVTFGTAAGWSQGGRTVDATRLAKLVLEDRRIRDVRVDLVEPGEDTRIIHIRDDIEPRLEVEGRGHVYPGICGHSMETVGDGVTVRYSGIGVLIASEALPHIRRTVSAATDSLIDMSGPGAVTVYSTLRYLVLTITTAPDIELTEWNEALLGAGHRVAADLAGLVRGQIPPRQARYAL